MKITGILFSAPMVRAILSGAKTQTRRLVKNRHLGKIGPAGSDTPADWGYFAEGPFFDGWVVLERGVNESAGNSQSRLSLPCPYGAPGDRLWVRESLRIGRTHPRLDGGEFMVEYAADGAEHPDANWGWMRRVLPSIHMPRGMARIRLEITDVRVERVQAISDADISAEGVTPDAVRELCGLSASIHPEVLTPRDLWRWGWEAINGIESWDANPWVWALTFRRIDAEVKE